MLRKKGKKLSSWLNMKKSGEDVDTSKYAGFSLEVSLFQTGRPFLPNLGTVLRTREQWRALILIGFITS